MITETAHKHSDFAPKPNRPVRPASGAIIRDENGRILVMKRAHSDYWCVPSGWMEVGESAEQCCVREVQEETGLDVRVMRLVGLYSDPRSIIEYPSGDVLQGYLALFECTFDPSASKVSPESDGFAWIDQEALGTYNFMPDHKVFCRDAWADRPEAFIR
jgi:8-oxo-dGTP pyrophosphatase MutT (NUDIX family)